VDIKTIKISGSEKFNIQVLQFESDDTTVQSIIEIAKKHLKEGDTSFAEKEYEDAIEKYTLVVKKLDTKLTDENREKIKNFRDEVVKRGDTAYAMMYKPEMENIDAKFKSESEADESSLNKIIGKYNDLKEEMKKEIPPEFYGENVKKLESAIYGTVDSCYVAICGLHEKLGDSACGDYSFDKGYAEYRKALEAAGKIKSEAKGSIEARYNTKLEATQKTGQNYLVFKVKSYTDRAQIYNFDDKTSDAKSMLKEARKYMTGGMMKFVTLAAVKKYNAMAKVLEVDRINSDTEPELYAKIQEEIKNEKEAEQQRLQAEEQKKQQQYIADLKKKGDYKTGKTATFGHMEFVLVTDGTFTMGSPESEAERGTDEKQHTVTVSPFWIGKYEVTQKQYEDVMGTNPSSFKGDNLPVEDVSWYDVVEYCNKMSEKYGLKLYYNVDKNRKDPGNTNKNDNIKWTVTIAGGNGFRLPTEAEWEYACRAGTTTAFCYGYKLDSSMANFDGNCPYNSGKGTYREKTTVVGSFKPNAWGLYDMHGDVWEWCWDWYDSDYYSKSPAKDPEGADGGEYRVLRGGSWFNNGYSLRSAFRNYGAIIRYYVVGFRVARSVY